MHTRTQARASSLLQQILRHSWDADETATSSVDVMLAALLQTPGGRALGLQVNESDLAAAQEYLDRATISKPMCDGSLRAERRARWAVDCVRQAMSQGNSLTDMHGCERSSAAVAAAVNCTTVRSIVDQARTAVKQSDRMIARGAKPDAKRAEKMAIAS